jgi:hypothetical protein
MQHRGVESAAEALTARWVLRSGSRRHSRGRIPHALPARWATEWTPPLQSLATHAPIGLLRVTATPALTAQSLAITHSQAGPVLLVCAPVGPPVARSVRAVARQQHDSKPRPSS